MSVADCPREECDGEAEHVDERHSIHLYRHEDDMAQCQECGHMFAYRGRAVDDVREGLAFYVPTIEKGAARPQCSVHGDPMQPTKYWPDEEVVQFKCTSTVCERDDNGRPIPIGKCQRVATEQLVDADEVDA